MPVDTKSQELIDAEDNLDLVKTLWGGTNAMREAGKKYLPQEPGEEKQDYDNRKNRTTLTNIFKKTINTYTGRIFEERVTIENQPGMEAFSENVDLEGRDFHRFAYDVTRYSLRDGLRFILVEAPIAEGVQTRADEVAAGIRPYFVEIDVRNVLGWKTETVGSQKVISQFRMKEMVKEDEDEFSQKTIEQIRVIEPLLNRTYRQDSKGNWQLYQEIPTTIGFVPVVPIFADRHGFWNAEPPLIDIAWMNVEHWQKSSDHNNILHVARVPILHWAGYKPMHDADGNQVDLTVGPNTLAKSPDPQARLEYVEHTGAAVGAGSEDLRALEDRMVAMGAEFMMPQKSGDVTATEKAIDESGDISELSAFAQNLKDSLYLAMSYVAKMMGTEFTGEITLNTDLGIMTNDVNIQELVKIRANGDISREGMYEVLNNEWGTNLDPKIEQERIENEPPALGGGGGMF